MPPELLWSSYSSPTGWTYAREYLRHIFTVLASPLTPSLAFLGLYAAAFTRCAQVPATLLPISPGGTEILAPSALSGRKTMIPSNPRSSSVPLRSSIASPISQVWMTSAPKRPSGTQFPSLEGLLSISKLLKQASLQPCCVFEPVQLPLRRDWTQIALNILNSLARPWPSRYSYF